MTAKDVIERQRQVEYLRSAIDASRDMGLPIVVLTQHAAGCVLHRIEELEEALEDARLQDVLAEAQRSYNRELD